MRNFTKINEKLSHLFIYTKYLNLYEKGGKNMSFIIHNTYIYL